MYQAYILDILIEDGMVSREFSSLSTPIWALIRVDGVKNNFTTNQVPASPNPRFNTATRFVLNLPDLNGAHLKASLCTYKDGRTNVFAISQIRLSSLPFGRPKRFSFPLMNSQNTNTQAATLNITATISQMTFHSGGNNCYPQTQPNSPQMPPQQINSPTPVYNPPPPMIIPVQSPPPPPMYQPQYFPPMQPLNQPYAPPIRQPYVPHVPVTHPSQNVQGGYWNSNQGYRP